MRGDPPIALGNAPPIDVPQFLVTDKLVPPMQMSVERRSPAGLLKSLLDSLLIVVAGLVMTSTVYFTAGRSAPPIDMGNEPKPDAVGLEATILRPVPALQGGVRPVQRRTDNPRLTTLRGQTSTSMACLGIVSDDDTVMLGGRNEASTEPASPPVRRLDPAEVQLLLQQGERFMAAGDVASARVVLHRAALAGDPGAALALGGSYDPRILEKIGVVGLTADRDEARNWYERAQQFGSPEALRRMSCFRIDDCARDLTRQNLLYRTCS
jgi:hypothetical protein